MAIAYPLTFPSALTVNAFTIAPRNAVSRSESPFSFSEQVYDWGGEMWSINGSLPLMKRETAEAYVTFLLKLKGRKGTFLFEIPDAINPLGSWGGTPVVDGDSQTGNELAIRGLPSGVTGVVKAGDYIQLGTGANTRLHKVLDDADSDGSGETTLTIFPSIRTSPADGDTVIYQNCKGLFRLTQESGVDIDTNKHYFMQFSAMEAL